MQQPAWNNNNWGYDTLAKPFAGGQLYLENSYSFLKNAGQWYLDPQAGQLYYKARLRLVPQQPRRRAAPADLADPDRAAATAARSHDITFQGIAFEHTTWLTPSSSIGYADQQTGTFLAKQYSQPSDFLTSCQSGCQLFEATRNSWNQVPAAVQVSAAANITFTGDTFTHLGQVAPRHRQRRGRARLRRRARRLRRHRRPQHVHRRLRRRASWSAASSRTRTTRPTRR